MRLREGRTDDARAILERVAASDSDASCRAEARLLLERLSGGDAAAGREP